MLDRMMESNEMMCNERLEILNEEVRQLSADRVTDNFFSEQIYASIINH